MEASATPVSPLDASQCLSQPTFQLLCAALTVADQVLSRIHQHDPSHELWNKPLPARIILDWLHKTSESLPNTQPLLPGWYIISELEKIRVILPAVEEYLWAFFIRREELKDDSWPEQEGDQALKVVPDAVEALRVASKVKLDLLTMLPDQFDVMLRQFIQSYLSETLSRHHSDIRNDHYGSRSCSICTHVEWARILLHLLDQRSEPSIAS